MATWGDPKSSEDDSEEEQANVTLMAYTEAHAETIESELDSEEISSELSHSKFESYFLEVLEKYRIF